MFDFTGKSNLSLEGKTLQNTENKQTFDLTGKNNLPEFCRVELKKIVKLSILQIFCENT